MLASPWKSGAFSAAYLQLSTLTRPWNGRSSTVTARRWPQRGPLRCVKTGALAP